MTGTMISGYQGSPLGGLDKELARNRELVEGHHVKHVPGLNEELGATSAWGSQLAGQLPGQRIGFHREAIGQACEQLRSAYPPPTPFPVSQARQALGSTRKFVVPLLQHLQATGQSLRRGDLHTMAHRSPGGE